MTRRSPPARTSLFTGLYVRHHGVSYNVNLSEVRPDPPEWIGLAADVPAFPALLAGQGYRTALFGKLHATQEGGANFGLQHLRLAEGKGQFVPYRGPPDDYRQYLRDSGYPDGAWRTWELPAYARDGHVTSPLPEKDYIDTWTADQALTFLEQVEDPFCAWVSFSNPHTPWDPPAPYDHMYDPAEIPFPARREGELEDKHPAWVDSVARTIPAIPPRSSDPQAEGGIERAYARFPDARVRAMLAAYYGQVSQIDAQVGRILALLVTRGLRERTLIVFTADHGDYLGNNWAFFKYGVPYDSLARVPFVVSWPGRCAAGARRDELVSLIDLAPTFLDSAGAPPLDRVDGRSLLPLLARQDVAWRDQVLVESRRVQGLLTAGWKYIAWEDGFAELYNRRTDPHDLYNLARQPEHAARCRSLAERLAHM